MKIFKEFKDFIARGNVMDMAIGIIIGGAFKSIVDSLVGDILNPILGIAGGLNFDQYVLTIPNTEITIFYGKFITAIISFLIMAVIVFLLMKAINTVTSAFKKKKEEAPAAPTTKMCPFCRTEINIEACKCPNCTSDLPEEK